MLEKVLLLLPLPCPRSFSDALGDTGNLYASTFLLPTGLDEREELLQCSGGFNSGAAEHAGARGEETAALQVLCELLRLLAGHMVNA